METEYKFTDNADKKLALIEEIKKVPIIRSACSRIGIPHSTFYRWKEADPEFNKAVEEAGTVGVGLVNDMCEAQLISAIRDKNLRAIEMWLRAHHRSYSSKVELSGKVEVDANEPLSPEQQKLISQALQLAGLAPQTSTAPDNEEMPNI